MLSHPLTNFEIQKYYQKKCKFNGVYSRNSLPETKDGAYVINLDEYKSIGTHWIALYVNANKVTYFDSFGVKHIPKDIRKSIGNKKFKTNICRTQIYDSIMCGCFYIRFLNFMVKGKSLLEYTNLFFPHDY